MKHDFTNIRHWVSGERFVGREKECSKLTRYVEEDLSCAIVGLRRIGKTSVLKEIKRRLQAQASAGGRIVIELDFEAFTRDIETPEATFYRELSVLLDKALLDDQTLDGNATDGARHSKLYEALPKREGHSVFDEYRFFEDFLVRQYRNSKKKVILLLDEFDSCVQLGEGMAGFLKRIRSLIDNTRENGFVCVLASSRSIHMLESKTTGDASTLNNALQTVRLAPFARQDFERLCDQSSIPLGPAERDAFFARSFGHPFLAGLLLHHYNELHEESGKAPAPEEVIQCARCDFETYFSELQGLFMSFPVGRDFEAVGIRNWFDCLVWREMYAAKIPQRILETFMRYGFWKGEERLPEALHEFVERDSMEVWPELRRIETGFRRLIEKGLKSYYADDSEEWFLKMELPEYMSAQDPWKDKRGPFQKIVEVWRKKRLKEFPGSSVSYLDCTYLDDLMNLMMIPSHWECNASRHWKGFGVCFNSDKEKCREMLLAAGRVRNPSAHFVDIPSEIKAKFSEAARYLAGALERGESEM